jgi:hypothetical protein
MAGCSEIIFKLLASCVRARARRKIYIEKFAFPQFCGALGREIFLLSCSREIGFEKKASPARERQMLRRRPLIMQTRNFFSDPRSLSESSKSVFKCKSNLALVKTQSGRVAAASWEEDIPQVRESRVEYVASSISHALVLTFMSELW